MFTDALFEPPVAGADPDLSYQFEERVIQAVNVAMAVRRPLLVTGEPGSGKSTLARAVAEFQNWSYVEHIFTSRSELSDLTVGSDAVRRLADAQLRRLLPDWAYLTPGAFWWAFDPASAPVRGHAEPLQRLDVRLRHAVVPVIDRRLRIGESGDRAPAVVLLDEIDKADPDLPNDLLGPLDRAAFDVPGREPVSAKRPVFVVITSNGERRLPPAFLRRCVHLSMSVDGENFFETVARAHFGARDDDLYTEVADVVRSQRAEAPRRSLRKPSTAEYLDTVRACIEFGERPSSANWEAIKRAALTKADSEDAWHPAVVGRG